MRGMCTCGVASRLVRLLLVAVATGGLSTLVPFYGEAAAFVAALPRGTTVAALITLLLLPGALAALVVYAVAAAVVLAAPTTIALLLLRSGGLRALLADALVHPDRYHTATALVRTPAGIAVDRKSGGE